MSNNQVPRLLALIPYLQRHPGAKLVQVAEDFGITPRQLRKDLDVLWFCGLPGLLPGDLIEVNMDAVDQDGVIHLTNADYLSRPVHLSPTEALTLVVVLQSLRQVAGPEATTAIDGALTKVRSALGSRTELADQVVIDVRSAAEQIRDRLDRAIAGRFRIEFEYQREDVLEPQRRSIDPHSVAVRDGYAYLEGWDTDRQDWRSFRLDRIGAAVVTSIPAGDHGAPPVNAGRSWLSGRPDARRIDLWLAASARWVTETYPVEEVRPATSADAEAVGRDHHPDDVVVTVLIAEPNWLTRLLLRLGDETRVLGVAGQGEEATVRAREALSMHAAIDDRSGRVES